MQKCQNLCTLWTAICFQSDFCVNKNDTVNISNIFCGIFKRKVTFKTINLAANWGKYLFYVLKYCNVQIYFVLCNSFTSWGKLSENFDYYTYFMITIVQGLLLELCMELSGVFSTGATGAMASVILRKGLIAPAVSNRNGKILLTLGTRNIKILNTLLQ